MIKTTKVSAFSLAEIGRKVGNYGNLEELYTTDFKAEFQKNNVAAFELLIKSCYKAAFSVFESCKNSNYEIWILYVTPQYDLEKIDHVRNSISLKKIISSRGFRIKNYEERAFIVQKCVQKIGVFKIDWDDAALAFEYQSYNSNSIEVISNRNLTGDLEVLYRLVSRKLGEVPEEEIQCAINWYSLASEICQYGDIVSKTWGGFDDLEREIQFFYDKAHLPDDVLDCLEIPEAPKLAEI